MGKYFKKFETEAQYTAAKSGLILPNVSLVTENYKVYYNPLNPTPPTPSHDYVEIGGIKWATMNVGANSVTDAGLYFQWGDTNGYTDEQIGDGEGQKVFSLDDYKYYDTESWEYTKYNDEDGLITLQTGDDAVTAAWGGNWRMPTISEFANLGEAVNTVWTDDYQDSGIAGLICTDKTDSSKVLFFPACGYASDGYVRETNSNGYYWSSGLSNYDVVSATPLRFYDGFVNLDAISSDYIERYYGILARGVLDE